MADRSTSLLLWHDEAWTGVDIEPYTVPGGVDRLSGVLVEDIFDIQVAAYRETARTTGLTAIVPTAPTISLDPTASTPVGVSDRTSGLLVDEVAYTGDVEFSYPFELVSVAELGAHPAGFPDLSLDPDWEILPFIDTFFAGGEVTWDLPQNLFVEGEGVQVWWDSNYHYALFPDSDASGDYDPMTVTERYVEVRCDFEYRIDGELVTDFPGLSINVYTPSTGGSVGGSRQSLAKIGGVEKYASTFDVTGDGVFGEITRYNPELVYERDAVGGATLTNDYIRFSFTIDPGNTIIDPVSVVTVTARNFEFNWVVVAEGTVHPASVAIKPLAQNVADRTTELVVDVTPHTEQVEYTYPLTFTWLGGTTPDGFPNLGTGEPDADGYTLLSTGTVSGTVLASDFTTGFNTGLTYAEFPDMTGDYDPMTLTAVGVRAHFTIEWEGTATPQWYLNLFSPAYAVLGGIDETQQFLPHVEKHTFGNSGITSIDVTSNPWTVDVTTYRTYLVQSNDYIRFNFTLSAIEESGSFDYTVSDLNIYFIAVADGLVPPTTVGISPFVGSTPRPTGLIVDATQEDIGIELTAISEYDPPFPFFPHRRVKDPPRRRFPFRR